MAVDERARHELRARLEEVLGADEATTPMHYLPLFFRVLIANAAMVGLVLAVLKYA